MQATAYAKVYGSSERRGIDALIPTKAEPIKSAVPLRRFRYDARNDIVKCPRGQVLRRRQSHGSWPLLLCAQKRLHPLRPRFIMPFESPHVESVGHQVTTIRFVAGQAPARALVSRRPEALPASPLALGRIPWRGQDVAWTWTRCPPGPIEYAHPGIPDCRRDQPKTLAAALLSFLLRLGLPLRSISLETQRQWRETPGMRCSWLREQSTRICLAITDFFNSPTVHKHRNILAHAPDRLHDVLSARLQRYDLCGDEAGDRGEAQSFHPQSHLRSDHNAQGGWAAEPCRKALRSRH